VITLFEQAGAILLYHSIPQFVREAVPAERWQHCREECIAHVGRAGA